MTDLDALSVVRSAGAITGSHSGAPARDVLDLVMEGRRGCALDFRDSTQPHGSWTSPPTPFGALLARAFDRVMTAGEWAGLTGPHQDPAHVAGMMDLWNREIVLRFIRRYAIAGAWASAIEASVAQSTCFSHEPATSDLD